MLFLQITGFNLIAHDVKHLALSKNQKLLSNVIVPLLQQIKNPTLVL